MIMVASSETDKNGVYSGTSNEKLAEEGVEKLKKLYDDLLYALECKYIYLDSNINLTKLSFLLCTNTTYLSRCVNRYFHCNLKCVLNKYRVEYAKKLLCEERCCIEKLAKQCGFTSRSTFYSAFSKYEKVTPAEYRAKHHSMKVLREIEANINNLLTV